VKPILDQAAKDILAQKEEVTRLVSVASQHPFYKYNGVWSRELQNLVGWDLILFNSTIEYKSPLIPEKVFSIEFCAWLGGLSEYKTSTASFLTIEEVGKLLDG
jgi:hypothetical protein